MSHRILLADDSVTIQKVIELTFMDQDYRIQAVSNGDDALAQVEDGTADLVIADVHMPGASGYEVARRSKDRDPGVPVLLLVGTFEPFDEGEYEASGADAYLKKPFDSQELLQLVDRLMSESAGPAAPAGEAEPEFGGYEEADLSLAEESFELEELAGDEGEESAAAEPVWGNLDLDGDVEEPFERTAASADPDALSYLEAEEPSHPQPLRLSDEEPGETFALESETLADDGPSAVAETPAPMSTPAVGAPSAPAGPLSDEDVERIARRVADLIGERILRDVAWEVVPDLAEVVIRDRIRELESQLE